MHDNDGVQSAAAAPMLLSPETKTNDLWFRVFFYFRTNSSEGFSRDADSNVSSLMHKFKTKCVLVVGWCNKFWSIISGFKS